MHYLLVTGTKSNRGYLCEARWNKDWTKVGGDVSCILGKVNYWSMLLFWREISGESVRLCPVLRDKGLKLQQIDLPQLSALEKLLKGLAVYSL